MVIPPKWLGRTASLGLAAVAFLVQTSSSKGQEIGSLTPARTTSREAPIPANMAPVAKPAPSPLPTWSPSVGKPKFDAGKQAASVSRLPNAVPTAPVNTPKSPAPSADVAPGVVGEIIPPPAAAPKSAWYDHPQVRIAPRPGWFVIFPKGCGYYSLVDCVKGVERKEPPKAAYPPFGFYAPGFFDADFRYIDNPNRTEHDFFDPFHRVHLGDNWLFGTGGQAWWRHAQEVNSRLSGFNNNYDLLRARIYGDLWYKDRFRIYGEFISAWSFNQDLAPLPIDQNRADLLNLFVDLKIGEIDCHPVYLRAGRQELSIGSQRAISTIDWANTRRTFQGVRAFYQGDKFDFDSFWVRPVPPLATKFDSWDDNQDFAGLWLTYRPKKGQAADLYYLYLSNTNTVTQQTIQLDPTRTHTVGTRYVGDEQGFLWDFEGMLQGGQRGASTIRAAAATAGLGYHWADAPLNPIFWAYYDWASGDGSPNNGNFNTYNQQFPFGHYYFGFLDLVGRQNIRDFSLHTYLFPAKWITFNAQYHFMQLDKATDALYNAAGNVSRFSKNGSAGGNVGQELDLLANFHVGPHTDLMFGYSKLFAGDFIRNTGNANNSRSPELLYFIYTVRW